MMQQAQKDGFNLYGVEAFGRLSIVSSDEKGDIGDVVLYPNGGIGSNRDAGAFIPVTDVGAENHSENLLFGKHPGISFYKKRNPFSANRIAANYYREGYRYGKRGDYFNYRLRGVLRSQTATINGFNEAILNSSYSAFKRMKRKQAFMKGFDNGIQFYNHFESLYQDEQNGIWIFRLTP